MNRNEYESTINGYIEPLEAPYDGEGSKIITEKFFDILNDIDEQTKKPRIELAITQAKRNYNQLNHVSPAMKNLLLQYSN